MPILTTIFILGNMMSLTDELAATGVYSPPQTCSKAQHDEVFAAGPRCETRMTLVKLALPSDNPNIIEVHPPEVEVARCGGVCLNNRKCVAAPGAKSSLEVTVQFSFVDNSSTHSLTSITKCSTIQVEKHDACVCGCDIGPSDCNEKQFFDRNYCKCRCKYSREMSDCARDTAKREWDENACKCKCKQQDKMCATNFLYDNRVTCRCHQLEGLLTTGNANGKPSDHAGIPPLGVAVAFLALLTAVAFGAAIHFRRQVNHLKRYNVSLDKKNRSISTEAGNESAALNSNSSGNLSADAAASTANHLSKENSEAGSEPLRTQQNGIV